MKARLLAAFTGPLCSTGLGGLKLRWRRAAATILGVLAAVLFPRLVPAVELTESQGAAYAYPALLDTSGKKLANGEFKQSTEEGRLRVEIEYEFDDGQHFEENAVLRQKPELIQEKWSWKESKNGKVSRQFTADFRAKTATALTHENNEAKQWSENIEVEPGEPSPVLDSRWRFKIYESV